MVKKIDKFRLFGSIKEENRKIFYLFGFKISFKDLSDFVPKKNEWHKLFQEYKETYKASFNVKISNLLKGLDGESIEILMRAISVYCYMPETFCVKPTKREIDLHNEIGNFMQEYNKKIFLPNEVQLDRCTVFYEHGIREFPENIIEKIKNKVFLDLGACMGDSALVMQNFSPSKIYSFEPILKNFEKLKLVIEGNEKLKNTVVPIKKAMGEDGQIVELFGNIGGSCTGDKVLKVCYNLSDLSEKVECITIDKFCQENNLNVGLIKIDIEGFEYQTVVNAERTIKKCKPAMIISLYHTPKDFFEIKPLLESWDLGYKFKVVKCSIMDYDTCDINLMAYVD